VKQSGRLLVSRVRDETTITGLLQSGKEKRMGHDE
jgi:hypothetical protein